MDVVLELYTIFVRKVLTNPKFSTGIGLESSKLGIGWKDELQSSKNPRFGQWKTFLKMKKYSYA